MNKVLAICYHAGFLTMAIVADGALYDWKRHRIPRVRRSLAKQLVARFAGDYGISKAVMTPSAASMVPRHLKTMRLSVAEAKRQLLPHEIRPTHRAIIQRLVTDVPTLRPLISIAAATGAVSMTKPWQIAVLLAAVLALAHSSQTGELKHPAHLIY